ncbi:hypothetical protein ACFL58_01685 [Elusimicrobiota bacterium]
MELHELIKPLGILTYVFAAITFLSGLFRMKIKKHMTLAIITILFASAHAFLVITH